MTKTKQTAKEKPNVGESLTMYKNNNPVKIQRIASLICLLTGLFCGQFARAQSAGSVEAGLDILAKEIVAKSIAADRTTIAVLPFPNADGSCSVLSTYLVDELILGLFNVPDAQISIIERSQMEALLSEIKIGEGGLLNPETTQELGKISGVQALIVGTIAVIGDSVRVNARLVNTESGKTISAAAVTLPRTNAVSQLLEQPLADGSACGTQRQGRTGGVAGSSSGSTGVMRPNVASGEGAVFEGESVLVQINKVVDAGKNVYRVVGLVSNKTQKDIKVMWMGPVTLLDIDGNAVSASGARGILNCGNVYSWSKDIQNCRNADSDYTVAAPSLPVNFVIEFKASKGQNLKEQISLKGRVYVRGSDQKVESFNFPALVTSRDDQ